MIIPQLRSCHCALSYMVEETKRNEEGIAFQSSKWHVQTSAGRKTKVTGRRSVCLDGGSGGEYEF